LWARTPKAAKNRGAFAGRAATSALQDGRLGRRKCLPKPFGQEKGTQDRQHQEKKGRREPRAPIEVVFHGPYGIAQLPQFQTPRTGPGSGRKTLGLGPEKAILRAFRASLGENHFIFHAEDKVSPF